MVAEPPGRYWQIDAARGIAIAMMVVYHAAFDLATFGDVHLEPLAGFWLFLSNATAASFTFLVGVALPLSYARALAAVGTGRGLWWRYLIRGLRVLTWALILTCGTWWLFPQAPIVFGILHLIGVAIPLASPLIRHGYASVALGVGCLLAGYALRGVAVDWPWLVWLGVRPVGFTSLDYRPLLPWLGAVLLGVGFGNALLARVARRGALAGRSPAGLGALLACIGRHSLAIYLTHQPILLALLWALGLIDLSFLP